MKRLTLRLDPEIIELARELADEKGTSVSSLFERFVLSLARKRSARRILGPITRMATGLVTLPRGKDEKDVLAEALLQEYRSAR